MGLNALLLILIPFLLVNITLVSSHSEEYLFVKETSVKPPIASPKRSPFPAPPFYKPVPTPLPSPPKALPTPPPPAKVSPPLPVKKPTPPPSPPAKVTPPPPPVYKPVPPSPPTKVSPPPPPDKPSAPPPPSRPRTTKDCIPLCTVRCKLHSRKNVCLRACVTCCDRCKCVPPGHYGNREKCGKCYTDMTTRGGRTKCP